MHEIIKKEMLLSSDAIKKVAKRITPDINRAINYIYDCPGKLVTTGMGKSGFIARKISATFASTGTTSIYLHPAEGLHGDLGLLSKGDVVLALSNSGNTQELVAIIPFVKFNQIPLIAITGNLESVLAKNSEVVIDASIEQEIEPFGLVPTASTTVQLTIGDALAVAVLQKKGFQIHDFARFHPGGSIGKKLLYKISDLMHSGPLNPVVTEDSSLQQVIEEISNKGLGCSSIINQQGKLVGIITDGDLRRFFSHGNIDLSTSASKIMSSNPKCVHIEKLAVEALNLMEKHSITMLPITNSHNEVVGIIHLHDLIKAGII